MGLDMYLSASKMVTDHDAVAAIDKLTAQLPAHYDDDESGYYFPLWDHTPADTKALGRELVDVSGLAPLVGADSSSITVTTHGVFRRCALTVAYWRKANAIHGWFVENCQGGVDACQISDDIPAEQLAHLIRLCEQALNPENDPEQILPPQEGFFFGGTEIDEYYRQDLQHTIDELTRVIATAAQLGGNITFNYRSSW